MNSLRPASTSNRSTYEKYNVVLEYAGVPFDRRIQAALQIPEVMILVKYKANFWDTRVLDIGVGAGRTTAFLVNFTKYYIGIDYSSAMIDFCKRRFKNANFIRCDVRDMRIFGDGEFDFVLFSYNGLDNISHHDRLTSLQEIHRVLRASGIFVFSSHNKSFRNAISHPKIHLTLNLRAQLRYTTRFFISIYNYFKNKRRQYFGQEYSILIDEAHNYSVLNYYIDKVTQISQLRNIGFETIEMYDIFGNILRPESDDSNSAWIYYVARKTKSKSTITEVDFCQ